MCIQNSHLICTANAALIEYDLNTNFTNADLGRDHLTPAYWAEKLDVFIHSAIALTSTAT